MQIRDVNANDIDDVLELNEASVPHVNSIVCHTLPPYECECCNPNAIRNL